MKRHPEECYDLIENMTAHYNDWDTSAQRSESSSSITSSFLKIVALKAEMAEINKNLMKVLQINQQVKAVTPSCETCGGPHSYNDCPSTVGQTQNIYVAGAYNQGGNSYQPQGNHNLLSYRSDNYLGPPGFNQNQNQNNQIQNFQNQNRNQGNNHGILQGTTKGETNSSKELVMVKTRLQLIKYRLIKPRTIKPSGGMMCQGGRKEIQTKGVISDPIHFDTLNDMQEFFKMLVSIVTRKSMKLASVLNLLNHVILKSKIRYLNRNRGNWSTPTIQSWLAQLLYSPEVGNWWISVSFSGHFKFVQESRINTRSSSNCKLGIIKRMDDLNITIEEYIRLEDEKSQKRGKVYNLETATYVFETTVSSLYNNEIDFRISFDESDDEDCTVIFDKNAFSYKIIFVNDLKMNSQNDNDKVDMPLLPSPEPMVSYFDDLDFFKDFKNEFPAIIYNDAQTSKSNLLTELILSPQHIDEVDDKTSLLECDEEEQNVLNFNDILPFKAIQNHKIYTNGFIHYSIYTIIQDNQDCDLVLKRKEKSLRYNNLFLGEYEYSSLALDLKDRRDEKEEIGLLETRSSIENPTVTACGPGGLKYIWGPPSISRGRRRLMLPFLSFSGE
nr:reverse transcriptase domain-containing protein [Tanacetum cinerariifolium]